ncbi:MAG: MarR family transcriptional regulator [Bacteroidetes bacterium]|jgi:DNA-binding MarR family transcriptional regulator|nr:MAG: MarR family transcriptional regulator [Bacteroidota bacterium]
MRIEEAIKQKNPFRSEHQRLVVNLFYTANWVQDQHKAMFKPYGVTSQQYNVLRILRGQYPNPISTSDIRERMLDKMSDVSRIVERLLKKKLLTRRVCKTDKRLVDVLITEDGLSLLTRMDTVMDVSDTHMLTLSEAEAQQLNDLLDKLRG